MFGRQNFWLKLLIFGNGLYAVIIITPRQLFYQFIILFIYIACDCRIVSKAAHAFLRFAVFLNVYWIMGILLGLDYIQMLEFNLRMIHLLLLSVYLVGSTSASILISDSRFLLKRKLFIDIYFYLIAALMFIKGYQRVCQRGDTPAVKHSFDAMLQRWFAAMSDSFAQSGEIGEKVTHLIASVPPRRLGLNPANVIALSFLTVTTLVYHI